MNGLIFTHISRAYSRKMVRIIAIIFFAGLLSACASQRQPIPPGVIPQQTEVFSEDEQYGHEVFNALTQTYQVDRSDANVNRVRDVVDKLVKAAGADHNPWHVYVLIGNEIKNAAATRGNFIFVWSGMLNTVRNDGELATILAHEIGHVLAGHTASDPAEETQRIIAGIAGAATGTVLAGRGLGGPVADLAELVVRASLEALILNPDLQAKELEADQIGLFMMADAGYNPSQALEFWERVKNDPGFASSPLEFMSSHPSSENRLANLRTLEDAARERYLANGGLKYNADKSIPNSNSEYRGNNKKNESDITGIKNHSEEIWITQEQDIPVYSKPDKESAVVNRLAYQSKVNVRTIRGRWLELSSPVQGFVLSRNLSPEN